MTFKVLQCNSGPHKRNFIFYRGVIILHSLIAVGYNSALASKSDAYFPNVQVEGGPPSNTFPSYHQGTVDPPNIPLRRGEESGTIL